MKVAPKQLAYNPHLLRWVANQLRVRMNSAKDYHPEQVLSGAKELF